MTKTTNNQQRTLLKTNPIKANFQTESQSGFDIGKAENLQKETVQMFDEKLKTAKNIIWGGIAMGVTFELVLVAKLLCWGTDIELHVLKELEQIQLGIAELSGKNPPAEN